MSGFEIGLLCVGLLLLAIYMGMEIGIALFLNALLGISLIRGTDLAFAMAGSTAFGALNDYIFAVVPLFVLMGLLVAGANIGRDAFDVAERFSRRLPGGLGVASVGANAVFAAITGVSLAAVAIFTKIAVPEMVRLRYSKRFATGVVAGSSILGMLIPPSLLLIVYAVLAEVSIGHMFLAGIVPGLLLAAVFALVIMGLARFVPRLVYADGRATARAEGGEADEADSAGLKMLPWVGRRIWPAVLLITLVLGGLYGGYFTPTEAGAMGAIAALVLALAKRQVPLRRLPRLLIETAHISASILFLVIAASLYSRMLVLTGLPNAITDFMSSSDMGVYHFLLIFLMIVLVLGCLLDSVSIMLITLPIALPIASAFGLDLIWFGVITVVAVEMGLITPPFGLSVFALKAALDDPSVSIGDIFAGAVPFLLSMLAVIAILIAMPWLATSLI